MKGVEGIHVSKLIDKLMIGGRKPCPWITNEMNELGVWGVFDCMFDNSSAESTENVFRS